MTLKNVDAAIGSNNPIAVGDPPSLLQVNEAGYLTGVEIPRQRKEPDTTLGWQLRLRCATELVRKPVQRALSSSNCGLSCVCARVVGKLQF